MKIIILILTTIALLLASGCSQKSEINEANKRIAELESQLASERGKNLAISNPLTASSPASSPEPVSSPAPSKTVTAPESTQLGNQWSYHASEDKMTGGTTYYASVDSTNTVNFSSPYSGEQHARLSLRTDPKYGKDIIFSIEKGQMLCRSYEDCSILIRFDNEKPINYSGVGPADNSSDTVFIRNYNRFAEKIQKAKIVRLSTNIYQEGAPVFEFDVSGFNQEKYKPKK